MLFVLLLAQSILPFYSSFFHKSSNGLIILTNCFFAYMQVTLCCSYNAVAGNSFIPVADSLTAPLR